MNKAIEIKAPNQIPIKLNYRKIFLGGSIEMGVAEQWQAKLVEALKDEPIIFLNPRRDDWDSTWEQKIENSQFNKQVTWELACLELADLVIMYFDPKTKSPISLLELGLHARKKNKLVVLCPEGFWRKGNVDIVCKYYDIPQVESFDELIKYIKK